MWVCVHAFEVDCECVCVCVWARVWKRLHYHHKSMKHKAYTSANNKLNFMHFQSPQLVCTDLTATAP